MLLFVMLGIAPKGTTLRTVSLAAMPYIACTILLVGPDHRLPQDRTLVAQRALTRAANARRSGRSALLYGCSARPCRNCATVPAKTSGSWSGSGTMPPGMSTRTLPASAWATRGAAG